MGLKAVCVFKRFPGQRFDVVDFKCEKVRIAYARGDIETLLELIRKGTPEVRREALYALAQSGFSDAGMVLKEIAKNRWNEHPETRIVALQSLESLSEKDAYADFVEDFITGESRIVEKAARKILSRIDPAGFPNRLARRGCTDHGAMNVYGRSRSTTAIPLIRDFLMDCASRGEFTAGGIWGRVYAGLRALEKIGTTEAFETISLFTDAAMSHGQPDEKSIAFQRYLKVLDAARFAMEKRRADGF